MMRFETYLVPVGFPLRFEKEKGNSAQVFVYGVFVWEREEDRWAKGIMFPSTLW